MVSPRTHTQTTDISGLSFVSGQIKTTAAGGGGVASDVSVAHVAINSGQFLVTAAGGGGVASDVSVAGVAISADKLHVDLPGVAISAGKISVTAPAAQGVAVSAPTVSGAVAVGDISGDVRVTAGNTPLPVLASISGDTSVTAGDTPLPVLASVSGDVHVTAGNSPIQVSAAAGNAGALRNDAVFNATVSNPIKFASIDVNAAACANLVGAVAGRRIRVLEYNLISAGTVGATFCTTGAFTRLTGSMNLQRGIASPFNPYGHFQTAVGSALSIQLAGAVSVAGHLTYQEVF